MEVLTLILFSICVGLLTWLLWRRWNHWRFLSSLGIRGPKPALITGNLADIRQRGFFNFIDDQTKRFGKIWGYYEGYRPVIVIADAEMAKQILIKEFHKFHSRKPVPMVSRDPKFTHVLDATGDRWKRLRRITSPSFSARRMKEMSPLINKSIDDLLTVFHKKCEGGKSFNIHAEFQRLTMDTIASCAFGIDADALTDNDSAFLYRGRKLFKDNEDQAGVMKLLIPLTLSFPSLAHLLKPIADTFAPVQNSRFWFLRMAKQVIEERKQNGGGRTDFIQLMLQAHDREVPQDADLEVKADEDEEKVPEDDKEATRSTTGKLGLTMEEMQANSFILMLAGYETTSTALAFSAHELSLHPEIQKKLQMEIDEYFPQKCRPDYITVHKLPYLDMVFNEVLRKHPIATIVQNRECFETCHVDDYEIPPGTFVQIDSNAVHQDIDLWGPEDPDLFIPDRFLPERKAVRHPLAFMPFGNGPRNCIGMRFALMESKIAIARMMKDYNIERCAETKVPLPIQKDTILTPSEGVYVRLTKRS